MFCTQRRNSGVGVHVGRVGSLVVTTMLTVTTVVVVGASPARAFGGTVSGIVRDSTGVPIPGATVYTQTQANTFNFPAFSATTDAAHRLAATAGVAFRLGPCRRATSPRGRHR